MTPRAAPAVDSGGRVTVAVRELRDNFYRAFRTGGVEPGQADSLAEATAFAITQLGQALERPLSILEAGRVPILGLPYMLRAESSGADTEVPSGSVVGDFAYFAAEALARGTVVGLVGADGARTSAKDWFDGCDPELGVQRLTATTREGGQVAGVLAALDTKSKTFLRTGIEVARDDWRRLEALAHRFLVSERAIDTAVSDIAT